MKNRIKKASKYNRNFELGLLVNLVALQNKGKTWKLFSTLKYMKLWIISPVVAKIQHGICKWIWCWQTSEATPQRGTCWTNDFLDPPENEISANQNKRIKFIFEQCCALCTAVVVYKLLLKLLFLCTLTTMKNVRIEECNDIYRSLSLDLQKTQSKKRKNRC